MKPSNLIITIPEPCHEDWNAMTPDKKGKFCSSCSKSVIDFSNKSDVEIKTILLENANQKVCGHFKKSQVNRPLNIRINFNQLPKNMSTTKVFAIALFFVFGTMLFSCTDIKGQKIDTIEVVNSKDENYTVGEMAMVESIQLPEDTTEIVYEKGDVVCTSQSFVNGGLSYYEVPVVQDTPKVVTVVEPEPERMIMGMMMYIPEKIDTVQTIDSTSSKIIKNNIDRDNINSQNDLMVYPNPSSGEFTIKYSVLKPANVSINIFDLNGKLVKTVANVANQYQGNYQLPVSMSEFENGIYVVSLINNGKRTSSNVIIQK